MKIKSLLLVAFTAGITLASAVFHYTGPRFGLAPTSEKLPPSAKIVQASLLKQENGVWKILITKDDLEKAQ